MINPLESRRSAWKSWPRIEGSFLTWVSHSHPSVTVLLSRHLQGRRQVDKWGWVWEGYSFLLVECVLIPSFVLFYPKILPPSPPAYALDLVDFYKGCNFPWMSAVIEKVTLALWSLYKALTSFQAPGKPLEFAGTVHDDKVPIRDDNGVLTCNITADLHWAAPDHTSENNEIIAYELSWHKIPDITKGHLTEPHFDVTTLDAVSSLCGWRVWVYLIGMIGTCIIL